MRCEAGCVLTHEEGDDVYYVRAIYVMWLRDMLRLRRDRIRIVTSLAQPVLWLLLIGSGLAPAIRLGGAQAFGGQDFDYLKFMFPGVLAMSVLFTAMFSGMSVAWDRDFGFLKEVLVAPVPRWAVALGKILGGSTVAVVQASIMLMIAPMIGLRLDVRAIATALPLMLLIGFAITSMAVAIAISVSTMEGFQMVSQFILMPMFMLSGAVFPLHGLPAWLEALVRINPMAYGVDPLRQVLLEPSVSSGVVQAIAFNPIEIDLLVMAGFTALMLGLAVTRFNSQA